MNNKDKILEKLRKSSMSYLARYEVSTYQFENTLKRKISYYDSDLNEKEKINILDQIKAEMIKNKRTPVPVKRKSAKWPAIIK